MPLSITLRRLFPIIISLPCIAVAATYTVNSTGDENNPADMNKTLREAVLEANAYAGDDTITFSSSLEGATIETSGGLFISDNLHIDGQNAPSMEIMAYR